MRPTIVLGMVASLLAGGSPAHARDWDLAGGSATTIIRSSSFDATSDSDLFTAGDLALAVSVVEGLPGIDALWAEARFSSGTTSAVDFGLYEAGLDLTTWQLGVRATRDLLPRVRLFAHADLGASHGTLTISKLAGPAVLRGSDTAAIVAGGVGVDLAAFRAGAGSPVAGFALGLRLELGYVAAADLDFAAQPVGSDDDAPRLDVVAAPLGALDTGGAVLRVGLFGRW
jgi:opacity protein-like surface antigen